MDYFKHYLELEPTYTQYLMSVVSLPWSLKIIYGIIADNIPICGSRRKSYIIINGILQYLSMFVLALGLLEGAVPITCTLVLNSISGAFIDVVVDALMVVQSRLDPEKGSENLQSF